MSAEIAGGRRSPEENAAIARDLVALRQQKAEADAKVRRQSEGLLDVSLDDEAQAPEPAPAPAPAAAPAAAAAQPAAAVDYSQYYSSSSADMVQAAATAAPEIRCIGMRNNAGLRQGSSCRWNHLLPVLR